MLPDRLEDLKGVAAIWVPRDWDEHYSYRRVGDAFELRWLGLDGTESWSLEQLEQEGFGKPLSLGSFLFDASISPQMTISALIASVLAALLWLGAKWSPPVSWWSAAGGFFFTAVAAIVVASILAGLHVALSQGSGH